MNALLPGSASSWAFVMGWVRVERTGPRGSVLRARPPRVMTSANSPSVNSARRGVRLILEKRCGAATQSIKKKHRQTHPQRQKTPKAISKIVHKKSSKQEKVVFCATALRIFVCVNVKEWF